MDAVIETRLVERAAVTTITVSAPNRDQAKLRFEEIADSVKGTPGVKVYHGYRRVEIGEGLVIAVRSER